MYMGQKIETKKYIPEKKRAGSLTLENTYNVHLYDQTHSLL